MSRFNHPMSPWVPRACAALLSALLIVACGGDAPPVPESAAPPPPPPGQPVADPACDDGNPCTDDLRTPDGQCVNQSHLRACDDGDLCTFDDRCDGAGSCRGTALSCGDDAATCGPRRSCDGTAQCAEAFPGADTPCEGGGRCDGAGACAPAAAPCLSDACTRREIDGAGACKVVEQLGQPVYEQPYLNAWRYGYVKTEGSRLVFRVVSQDKPLYQLHAPGIGQTMLSSLADEANDCQWCGCASPCTFYNTGELIQTSSVKLPGTVKLRRYVDYSVTHRESLEPIAGWIAEGHHGYVCAP